MSSDHIVRTCNWKGNAKDNLTYYAWVLITFSHDINYHGDFYLLFPKFSRQLLPVDPILGLGNTILYWLSYRISNPLPPFHDDSYWNNNLISII